MNILASAAAGLAGSVGSGLVNYLTGRSSQEYAAQLQLENWKKQFDYENQYNLPVNQLKRWASVGVNPFFNSSNSSMVGASTAQMSPQASAPSPFPFDFGSSFSQILSGLLNAASVKGKSVESDKMGEFLDAQTRKLIADAGYSETMQRYQNMANEVYSLYGRSKAGAELKNLLMELGVKSADMILKQSEAGYYDQKQIESLATEAYYRAKSVLGQKEIDTFQERFDMFLKEAESRIKANTAGATKDIALAKTEDALRSDRKVELQLENGLRAIQFTNEEEFSRSDRQIALDTAIEAMELKHKENQLYYWKFGVDVLKAVASGALSATLGFKLFKAAKSAKAAKGSKVAKAKDKNEFNNSLDESAEFDDFYDGLSRSDKKIIDEFLGGPGTTRRGHISVE